MNKIIVLTALVLSGLFITNHAVAQIDLGQTETDMERSKFLSDSVVTIEFKNSNYEYKIKSFKISIFQPHKDPVLNVPSDGNKIPGKVRELIRQAPKGTILTFEYIKMTSGGDTNTDTHYLQARKFTIVD